MKPLRKADQKVRRSKAIREVREDWQMSEPAEFGTIQVRPKDQRTCANRLRMRHRRADRHEPAGRREEGERRHRGGQGGRRPRQKRGRKARLLAGDRAGPASRMVRVPKGWIVSAMLTIAPIGPAASSASRSPLPQRNKPYRVRSRGLESRPVKPLVVLDNFPVALLIV
jgi:hypothetical protein